MEGCSVLAGVVDEAKPFEAAIGGCVTGEFHKRRCFDGGASLQVKEVVQSRGD